MRQQLDARRLERSAQGALGAQPLTSGRTDQARAARIDGGAVDVEALREQAQKTLATGRVEGEIGMTEIGGAGARRDLAAAALQTIAHLFAEPFGIVTRQLWSDRRADRVARRLGDIAPRRAQVAQCPVEHGVQETRAAVAHVRSRSGSACTALRCRSTGGSSSMMSSATSPGPKREAAAPCSQAAAAPARCGDMPWATKPSATPARTSPLPAVASSGGALALMTAQPSGAATTVSAPLRSMAAPLVPAAWRALVSLSPASAKRRRRQQCRAVDGADELIGAAGEGGENIGIEDDGAACRERRADELAGFSAGAEPGPEKNGIAPLVGKERGEVVDVADGLHDDPSERRGIDRKDFLRCGDGDQPGPGAGSGTRGKPRRARHHRAAGDERVAPFVFVRVGTRPGKSIEPQRRRVLEGPRADGVEDRGGNSDIGDDRLSA